MSKYVLTITTVVILSLFYSSCNQTSSPETLTAEVPVKGMDSGDVRNVPGLDVKGVNHKFPECYAWLHFVSPVRGFLYLVDES